MSYIHALTTAADGERFRYMTGGDKGILRAIANRDRGDLTEEDYDYAKQVLFRALDREWELLDEGRQADTALETMAQGLAATNTLDQLRGVHAHLTGTTYQPEIVGDHRRTSAAVHNEANRQSWGHARPYVRAIEIKEAQA